MYATTGQEHLMSSAQTIRQASRKGATKRIGAAVAATSKVKDVMAPVMYKDLDNFVLVISRATPYQLVEFERRGVDGRFLKDLSKRMEISQLHVFDMIGVPKATAEKKVSAGEVISGSGGQAAIGVAKLIAKAKDIVASSTAAEAKDFDAAKWLGRWLEIPQPALGGRKPSELLDTPTGLDVVLKVLGAIESGAYQ
jgi:putative toxin-antitoxin system antitoxin component (TIGR02293 family)